MSTSNDIKRWIRLPKSGEVCEFTGLKRGAMINLAKSGKIKAVSLRQPGRKRGNRMIWLESVFDYFDEIYERQRSDQLDSDEINALPGPDDADK